MNNKNHHTYMIEGMGKKYIGVRSCKCDPVLDTDYFGSCRTLNKAIQENGNDKFKKQILAIFGTRKHAVEYEIDLHNHFDVGRNPMFWNQVKQTSTGFDVTGVKREPFTEETRRKIGVAQKGKTISEEHKRAIGAGNRGKILSIETRKRMGESQMGHVISEETRRKISEVKKGMCLGKDNPFYGKHHTEDAKRKMSAQRKGRVATDETRKKMSEVNRGKNNPMYGKCHSEETRRKISKANVVAKQRIKNATGLLYK